MTVGPLFFLAQPKGADLDLTRAQSVPGWEGRTGLAERSGDGASVFSKHLVIILHSVTITIQPTLTVSPIWHQAIRWDSSTPLGILGPRRQLFTEYQSIVPLGSSLCLFECAMWVQTGAADGPTDRLITTNVIEHD